MEVWYDTTNREEGMMPFLPKGAPAIFAETTYPQGGDSWDWTLLSQGFSFFDKHLVQIHLNVPITKTKSRLFFVLCYSGFSFLQRVLPWVHEGFIQRIVDEDVKRQQVNLWKGAYPWRSTVGLIGLE
eukprot:TRINITY_DN1880_c0_g1_i3.p1 TRINITY_DN1880_c0_g1~~TRINITY_DN1880_c0_g1_i3.p1  ORF type:complete len:127 (-),score=27.64 TRINITY_DN1880_c0_g1_i3:275-655(-)